MGVYAEFVYGEQAQLLVRKLNAKITLEGSMVIMKNTTFQKLTVLITMFLFLSSCDLNPFGAKGSQPYDYYFRFSIKNETRTNIQVKLLVGEIPHPQAKFEEFTLVPDEIYQSFNVYWTNENGANCTVEPNRHDAVYNHFIPLNGLDTSMEYYYAKENIPEEELERMAMNREYFLNKLFSFILTISRNDEIIYRIVGWDIPDEDINEYWINEKLFGYYDTALEKYKYGRPIFYTKLRHEPIHVTSGTYFVKMISESAFLQEFNSSAAHVCEDTYWREH